MMNSIHNEGGSLPNMTRALLLGVGMLALPASGQDVIEVGGNGIIADTVLDPGSTLSIDTLANWTTEGNEAGGGQFIESHLASPDVVVPTTGNVTLTFDHRFNFEGGNFDGGAIFVSIDGAPATYVPGTSLTGRGYDGTATAGTAWPGGEEVFFGKSAGYDTPVFVQTVADLGVLNAGQTVSVEFRGGWDEGFTPDGTDWEINTVKLTDVAATDFLDIDFPLDGSSGFTLASAGGGALSNPWEYKQPTHRFEIDADTLTADTYSPNGTETVIDLNGANIQVVLQTGTLDVGDTFTLFDTTGPVSLTGSVGTLSVPKGIWDTSNLETAGTITCLDPSSPLIYEPFADLDQTLNGNTPGLGLSGTWSANSFVADGSLVYGGLKTEGGRAVVNPGGNNYQVNQINPGTTLTDAGLMADGATLWFSALIVNHTSSVTNDERTYLALGTGPADGFDRIGGNSGKGFTVAVSKNAEGGVTAQSWNGPGANRGTTVAVAQDETFLAVGKITWGEFGVTPDTFELYLPDENLVIGSVVSTVTVDFDQLGSVDVANAFDTISVTGGNKISLVPEFDELRFGATYADVTPIDVIPPVIASTDPVDNSPSGNALQQVVTFDKPVLVGTGDIRIVNETTPGTTTIPVGDSQIAVSGNTLTITPTVPLLGGESYHIEMDAGVVTSFNLIDFGGISDPTEWNFIVDPTPPSLVSIADNVSPLPILIDSTLTYTVTFDEAIDAGTVDTTDFANGGSASITVDSVSATADPAVFEVVVSTVSAGDLTLEIVQNAVITDTSANPLNTSSAIPDDTTIAVNNPTPTAGSIASDFQTTIASQNNANNSGEGEARYYHVSVNPNNPGTGWYCADLPNSETDGPPGFRKFLGPVVAYKFVGSANNDISSVAASGGEDNRITYTTDDLLFDGFGQQQLRLWDATDPGADLATGAGVSASGFNGGGGGFRNLSGVVGTVDISGLASGSLHIYYGDYNATPTLKVTMRDTDNVAADLVLIDAHTTGDAAENCELYLAEIDFVTDGFYDVIEYEFNPGNGRGLGTVLTGPDVVVLTDYDTWAALYDPADLSDPNGDNDNDGLTNDEERLFGLDPTSGASANSFSVPFNAATGTFSFTRRDPALTGLFTDIETSFDLDMWTKDDGAMLTVSATVGDVQTVDVVLSPGLLSAPDLFVRVNQNDFTLLSENFEDDDGGFTVVTDTGSPWAWGDPDSSGLGGTVTQGNGGSTNCWGTDIGNPGQYIDSTVTKLRSTVIDLTDVATATLTFAEAFDIEVGDTAVVNIIDDTTDTIIAPAIYTAEDLDIESALWNNVAPIDLTPYVGQFIRIEWSFTGFGGSTNDYLGWYIDDVTVQQTGP